MNYRVLFFTFAAFLALLLPFISYSHSLSDFAGTFEIGPDGIAAGDTATITITLNELEPGALNGTAVVKARITADGISEYVDFEHSGNNRSTASYRLGQGYHDVRVFVERNHASEFAMIGFHVSPTLQSLLPEERDLWFVPQGRFDAIPWLDNISGVFVGMLMIATIVILLRRNLIKYIKEQPVSPLSLLIIAAVGAVAMPFGAYWDISFHFEDGRESFFSPPHLVIYGGILLALIAVLLGIGRKPQSSTWWNHIKSNPPRKYAVLGMLFVFISGPLDELWHWMFGLDVSVWSPPHVLLIVTAMTAMISLAMFNVNRSGLTVDVLRSVLLASALLGGSVFLAEFEYPLPSWHVSQFRPEILHPIFLIGFTLIICLIAKRAMQNRYGAVMSVGVFMILRLLVYPWLAFLNRDVVPEFPVFLITLVVIAGMVDLFYAKSRRFIIQPQT
jgi:hypothetical protein